MKYIHSKHNNVYKLLFISGSHYYLVYSYFRGGDVRGEDFAGRDSGFGRPPGPADTDDMWRRNDPPENPSTNGWNRDRDDRGGRDGGGWGGRSGGGFRDDRRGYRDDRGGGFRDDRGGGFRDDRGGGFRDDRGGGFRDDRGGGFRDDRGGGFRDDRGGGFRDNRGGGFRDDRGGGSRDDRGGRWERSPDADRGMDRHEGGPEQATGNMLIYLYYAERWKTQLKP